MQPIASSPARAPRLGRSARHTCRVPARPPGRCRRTTPPLALLIGALLATLATPLAAVAEPSQDRATAGGYFRVMARPDFDGGTSRLGLWNVSGRLLNEGPWAALELKLDVLQPTPGTSDVWTSVHTKIEGGSIHGADFANGALDRFAVTQLYAKAGNVLFKDVTWQFGTLHSYFGDLGLYDMRPTDLFFNAMGLSALYQNRYVDVLVGVGDAGWSMKGDRYNTILTAGGSIRAHVIDGLELGIGGEAFYEPSVQGNRFAPHVTDLPAGVTYEDYYHGEVVQRFLELNPTALDLFPKPRPVDAVSWKAIAYLGFGGFGPLRWNNLFANMLLRHPQNFVVEQAGGRDVSIYVTELTDEQTEINIGNEMQLELVPGLLDLVWGVLYALHEDADNTIAATENDREILSTVLRLQAYLTQTVHILAEGSYASETSLQGNLWRGHHDSVFVSAGGLNNANGLEFGDLDRRETLQLKAGLVINPTGMGVFARPSLRILYGLQKSNMHNAFGNSFVETLDQFNEFAEDRDRLWHQVIAFEAEAWF